LISEYLEDISWKEKLKNEFSKDYFKNISSLLEIERANGTVFPSECQIFSAFNTCSFENTKVVIIGQDPYHGEGQANGLSFSVSKEMKIPPSLKNIFKELKADLNIEIPSHGNLDHWAQQGVLLLNSCLTVRKSEAGSHKFLKWEDFTDFVIKIISTEKENVVFLLWGNFAHKKELLIDSKKHLILKAAHPSPLARGAFFGSKPFSKTTNFLISKGIREINWG
jgi:uracil-DNA glycosylase